MKGFKPGKAIKVAVVTAATVSVLVSSASAARAPDWTHYEAEDGTQLVVKASCLQHEDSAAHLRLILFSPAGSRIVYGCFHHGF